METAEVLCEDLVGKNDERLGTLRLLHTAVQTWKDKLTMPRPIVAERPGGRLGMRSRAADRAITVMIKMT